MKALFSGHGMMLVAFGVASCGQMQSRKSQYDPGSRRDAGTDTATAQTPTPSPQATATPVPPQCIPRPPAEKKFNFVLGGQSNAVRLGSALLLDKIRVEFDGIIDPANFRVVGHSENGTNLAVAWKADGTASSSADGSTYRTFQSTLLPLLRPSPGAKPLVAGMFWVQGESDSAVLAQANSYAANLKTFIKDVRLTFDVPDLPFVLSRISSKQLNAGAHRNTVRNAQDAVALEVPGVKSVDIDAADVGPDKLHFTTDGFLVISTAFAKAMKNQLFPELQKGQDFCK